jgi:hypothetical protein
LILLSFFFQSLFVELIFFLNSLVVNQTWHWIIRFGKVNFVFFLVIFFLARAQLFKVSSVVAEYIQRFYIVKNKVEFIPLDRFITSPIHELENLINIQGTDVFEPAFHPEENRKAGEVNIFFTKTHLLEDLVRFHLFLPQCLPNLLDHFYHIYDLASIQKFLELKLAYRVVVILIARVEQELLVTIRG